MQVLFVQKALVEGKIFRMLCIYGFECSNEHRQPPCLKENDKEPEKLGSTGCKSLASYEADPASNTSQPKCPINRGKES